MNINLECLQGTTIPIEGITFKTQKELNDFLNRVHKSYPKLTSEQWRAVLFIAFDGLAIGFTNVDNKRV
ncbi:ORF166 [Staphylococcus phage Twort]|uniref:ORF166 n=1 Tax=Staphylococcus phage Twort (strain DSM 17442 / HER 48) TaxID=2908167 RepID=Q4Z923_BPTWO|nr:ORF166 [Staphylococcus phage Twort]AAX92439.1 ORF166 [Staphylococcus phage Twort]